MLQTLSSINLEKIGGIITELDVENLIENLMRTLNALDDEIYKTTTSVISTIFYSIN